MLESIKKLAKALIASTVKLFRMTTIGRFALEDGLKNPFASALPGH